MFLEEIAELKKSVNLFYNTEGNPDAFKLMVRHLSFAERLGYGKIRNGVLYITKEIYIVDFEKKIIEKKDKELKITPLSFFEDGD